MDSNNEDTMVMAIASWLRFYGNTRVMRAFHSALGEVSVEHRDEDRLFIVLEMPADGKMDKQALEAFSRILPDNLVLVALPDPLDADGAQRVTEEFSGCLRRRLDPSELRKVLNTEQNKRMAEGNAMQLAMKAAKEADDLRRRMEDSEG